MLAKRKLNIKKIMLYLFLVFLIYMIGFFIWKRQFKMEEMEKWITSNTWEWESGASVCSWSIIAQYRNDGLQYEIKNLHIKFLDGKECIVIWAYGNTMIVRDSESKRLGFYERWRGSSIWHEIW
jgi:hypothetical protein